MISLVNVSFSYGKKHIFEHFSLDIPAGARLAFTGPSGCGKTTLLRLCSGLLRPHRGSVEGYPKTVSFVFQENRLIPTLSTLDNAAIAGDRDLARALLAELGLDGEADTMPAQLSGGMARRVALARALCHPSPLLILDEPFTGLDAAMTETAAACVLRHASDRTILAVTHAPREAELLGAELVDLGAITKNAGN